MLPRVAPAGWRVDQAGGEPHQRLAAALKKGLERAGKRRSQIEVNLWPWIAVSSDRAEAINDPRATVAFYG